jgi:hypothetical protein
VQTLDGPYIQYTSVVYTSVVVLPDAANWRLAEDSNTWVVEFVQAMYTTTWKPHTQPHDIHMSYRWATTPVNPQVTRLSAALLEEEGRTEGALRERDDFWKGELAARVGQM